MSGTVCQGSICRSIDGATISTSKRKRSVTACWSDDSGDHYRTAFCQTGIDMSTFEGNRVILFEHGLHPLRATLPIGNALEYGVERYKGKNALIGTTQFWEDEFADARFEDYFAGRLKGWSIRAIPLVQRAPTAAERRARLDWADLEVVYEQTRLLEVSACTLPGKKGTLTIAVERGLAAPLPAVTFPTDTLPTPADVNRFLDVEYSARRERLLRQMPDMLREAIENVRSGRR